MERGKGDREEAVSQPAHWEKALFYLNSFLASPTWGLNLIIRLAHHMDKRCGGHISSKRAI